MSCEDKIFNMKEKKHKFFKKIPVIEIIKIYSPSRNYQNKVYFKQPIRGVNRKL